MAEKEGKQSQNQSKAFSERRGLANPYEPAICCSARCLKAGMENSKPKRLRRLRIINLFFILSCPFFSSLFCYSCLIKAQFGTLQAPICRPERRHGPPNTKQPVSAEPQLPSCAPTSRLPFHQPGCLVGHRVTSDLFRSRRATFLCQAR